MLYTVGNKKNYERYFAEVGNPKKAIGGSVWQTFEEASRHTENGLYKVYGVLADWNKETIPNEDSEADWHDLLVDAPLLRLERK